MKKLPKLLFWLILIHFYSIHCNPCSHSACNCSSASSSSDSSDISLTCFGQNDLSAVFRNIAHNIVDWNRKTFASLVLIGCEPQLLRSNLFMDLKFKSVTVSNCDAGHYDAHVFAGTADTVEVLRLELKSVANWDDVYHSVGHLTNLRALLMPANERLVVPDFAFGKYFHSQQSKIEQIYFSNIRGGTIERIGGHSFHHLNHLKSVNFQYVRINRIADFAFATEDTAVSKRLEITFSANLMDKTVIDKNAFLLSSGHRKVVINLWVDIFSICLFPFEFEVFGRFLDENPENEVHVNCLLNCTNSAVAWVLRTQQYRNQIVGRCRNGEEV